MNTEEKLREALQAVIASHELGMKELGERMRASNLTNLRIDGQAVIDAFAAIEMARQALALPPTAPVAAPTPVVSQDVRKLTLERDLLREKCRELEATNAFLTTSAPAQPAVRIYDYVWPQNDEAKGESVYFCNYTPGFNLERGGRLFAVVDPVQLPNAYLQREGEAQPTPAAPSQELGTCAQCKKPYRNGANTKGCPKCAPGLVVPESEFQKSISAQAPVTLTDDKIEQLAVDSEIVFRCGKKLLTPFLEHIDLRRNVHAFANAIIAALREKEKAK